MDDTARAERFAESLRALANPTRLRILEALREPTRAAEIRLRAGEERQGFSADRILSRPAIVQHLHVLEEARLVRRVGDGYVVDQQTMFSLLAGLGSFARLRPVVLPDIESTLGVPPAATPALPPRPRLLVVGGPEDGRAFELRGGGPWRVGRGERCEVRLDYDPHASRLHVVLERAGADLVAFLPADVKNPPSVDYAPLSEGERRALAPGAVLTVGASHLVLQTA